MSFWSIQNSEEVIEILKLRNLKVRGCQYLLLVPYQWNQRDYRFCRRLSVSLSVCLSVRPLGVRPLGFPDFSHSSFEILTLNLVYEFVST